MNSRAVVGRCGCWRWVAILCTTFISVCICLHEKNYIVLHMDLKQVHKEWGDDNVYPFTQNPFEKFNLPKRKTKNSCIMDRPNRKDYLQSNDKKKMMEYIEAQTAYINDLERRVVLYYNTPSTEVPLLVRLVTWMLASVATVIVLSVFCIYLLA